MWTRLLRFAQFGFQFATAMTTAAPAVIDILGLAFTAVFIQFQWCLQMRIVRCSYCKSLLVACTRQIVNSHSRFFILAKNAKFEWLFCCFLCHLYHWSNSTNIHFRHWHSLCPNLVGIVVRIVITSIGNHWIWWSARWIWLIDVGIVHSALKWTIDSSRCQRLWQNEDMIWSLVAVMWMVQAFWWNWLNFVFNLGAGSASFAHSLEGNHDHDQINTKTSKTMGFLVCMQKKVANFIERMQKTGCKYFVNK